MSSRIGSKLSAGIAHVNSELVAATPKSPALDRVWGILNMQLFERIQRGIIWPVQAELREWIRKEP